MHISTTKVSISFIHANDVVWFLFLKSWVFICIDIYRYVGNVWFHWLDFCWVFQYAGVPVAVQVESLRCYAFLCSLSQDRWQIELLAEFPSVLVPLAGENQVCFFYSFTSWPLLCISVSPFLHTLNLFVYKWFSFFL